MQRLIVVQLGLQLVAEGIVFAGLVMNLLQDVLRLSIRHQIGVAAFSFPEELEHNIFGVVYGHFAARRSVCNLFHMPAIFLTVFAVLIVSFCPIAALAVLGHQFVF